MTILGIDPGKLTAPSPCWTKAATSSRCTTCRRRLEVERAAALDQRAPAREGSSLARMPASPSASSSEPDQRTRRLRPAGSTAPRSA